MWYKHPECIWPGLQWKITHCLYGFDRHYVIVNKAMAVTRSWLCLHVVFGVPFFRRSYKGLIKDIPRLVCSEVLFKQLCPHRAVLLHTANPCWAKLPLMCINQPNCVMGERGLYSTVVILQLYDVFSQMGLAFAFELSLKLLGPEHWWCEDPLGIAQFLVLILLMVSHLVRLLGWTPSLCLCRSRFTL